jgi:hypothetical protein
MRDQAAQHEGLQGLRVFVTAPDTLPSLPAAVEVAAFRIAVEDLTNEVCSALTISQGRLKRSAPRRDSCRLAWVTAAAVERSRTASAGRLRAPALEAVEDALQRSFVMADGTLT